ncbi:hypothetical protein MGYG_07881 [Nannizzia gypsea CBS 118893]|uniref:Methyltransferase domain-containing protein n=1 Tax=Arthroderma gypseum (strain ATCC MYA-4604 / CBS 118893) TaxID=535722 RepID=E4V4F6_ARTGP|nr:hypothetical protein MGYG_07881 [Nannizzia gypsea CBS 118893]EFR04880.1 hypothetical protein MGYG_07881 [Nannizzia gypsea CBS 118893]
MLRRRGSTLAKVCDRHTPFTFLLYRVNIYSESLLPPLYIDTLFYSALLLQFLRGLPLYTYSSHILNTRTQRLQFTSKRKWSKRCPVSIAGLTWRSSKNSNGLGQPSMPDVDLYTEVLMDIVSKHRDATSGRQFTYLEISTGSGRVTLGILKSLSDASFNTSNINMVDLDVVQNMLDLAAKLESKTSGISPPVNWVLGNALELKKLPVLLQPNGHVTIDLLLFPFGSIVHMTGDGEVEQLFQQIAKVLTPCTGRAYISFMYWFLVKPGDNMEAHINSEVRPPPKDIQSAEFPGVSYRYEMKKSECQGQLVMYREDVQVFKHGGGGQRREIETIMLHRHCVGFPNLPSRQPMKQPAYDCWKRKWMV